MTIINLIYNAPRSWKPNASRTLLYLKFNNNLNDDSGNSASVSGAWLWYWTVWEKHYAEMTVAWSWTYITPSTSLWNQIWTGDFTVSLWGYPVTTTRWESCFFMAWYQNWWSPYPWLWIWYGTDYGYPYMWFNTTEWSITANMPANQRMHMCFTRVNWVVSWYINGEKKGTYNSTRNITNIDNFYILNRSTNSYQQRSQTWARVSEVIFEKVWWSDEDVTKYVNSVKVNYWL